MNGLQTSLGKLKLTNPVTVASGTFGLEYGEFFDLNLLGAYVTHRTITSSESWKSSLPDFCDTKWRTY